MPKKVKKISDWLSEIPNESISQKALYNHHLHPMLKTQPDEIQDVSDALMYAFDWEATQEGYQYWNHVHDVLVGIATKFPTEKMYNSSKKTEKDAINPDHYKSHPSGIECIQVTEHMNFCLGNAVKYIWRADKKDNAIQDLQKAAWYVNREIERRQKAQEQPNRGMV